MNKDIVKKRTGLAEQNHELIIEHIIDPENSPLPEYLKEQCNRVIQAAKLLDDYPNETHIVNMMLAKYRVSRTQIKKDIALARELFKTQHEFDWDFWFTWMIKDQVELIRECKLRHDLKQWNNAKKVLKMMIGDKPAVSEDPRRMEKNVINVQVNNVGKIINVPLSALRNLNSEDVKILVDSFSEMISEDQAEEIMNS